MTTKIETGRMEAFSDGVIAIILTIMVLELHIPHSTSFDGLLPVLPIFLSYVLSFIYVGVYWNNHHHMILVAKHINGFVLWANLHLLFWLSLIPFATAWMGRNYHAAVPTALYGFVLLMAAFSYWVLQGAIIAEEGKTSFLRRAIGKDLKGKISPLLYAIGIGLAFVQPFLAQGVYLIVAFLWLVPDRRIESRLME